jgi:DMSO/TMAO reductase YedYZ molybdopterin-dependent catalytic subunit
MLGAGAVVAAGGSQALQFLGRLPVLQSLVPEDGFYFYTVSASEPLFNGRDWELRIEGLVEQPLTLTYQELLARPQQTQVHDYMCVTGWSVKAVRWTGTLVSDLVALARPLPQAAAVSFDSADGIYTDSLSLAEARRPEVMLAHAMNEKPLKQERGAPLRLVVPFMFGYKGVKWVHRIRLTAQQEVGYWEQRGYDVDAYLQ